MRTRGPAAVAAVVLACGALGGCTRARAWFEAKETSQPADPTLVPTGTGWYEGYDGECARNPPLPGAMEADGATPVTTAPRPRATCFTYHTKTSAFASCACTAADCASARAPIVAREDTTRISRCTDLP